MLQFFRHRRWLLTFAITLIVAGLGGAAYLYVVRPRLADDSEVALAAKAEAPPDLQKLRDTFASGMAALQRDEGEEAVRHLSSFTFGSRAVEQYRLYYLANAYQLNGNAPAARTTLARLWNRDPRLIYANDAGFTLANLYRAEGDWKRAADIYASIARRADNAAIASATRLQAMHARLNEGDVAGALFSARNIVIHHPRSEQAAEANAFVRAITGAGEEDPLPLTPSERLERGIALIQGGDPQIALDELTALAAAAPHLGDAVRLQRGVALHHLRRYEESNKVLEPLTSRAFKTAIPALRTTAKNYAIVASSIDPNVYKTVKEKKRVGTVKVRVGKGKKRRTVKKPKYQTVSKTVKLIDLAKKNKKDEYDRLASERLKDLLSLQLDTELRYEVLNALIARAEAKNQDEYVQQLIAEVIKIDPNADPALQHFWDKGWAAYSRGDLATARKTFRYIADTYTHPNVRRQSEYWYARSAERQGNKEEAMTIYRKLASAPYEDLYALHAVSRGATRGNAKGDPFRKDKPDWSEIAEKEMPDELELAYELTALSATREAYLELRRNMKRTNLRYAEALMADVYNAAGNKVLMYRSLRRAYPQLATVEQDSVPSYFIRMYYPTAYGEEIDEHAKKQQLDPELVRALILQESYYNPKARSPVGATGLMQLMPPTAKEHAKKLGIVFAASRLENPEVNVQIGTYHLRMLVNLFRGNTYLAIASYNAGQGNVMKWRRAAPRKPIDEFLESIPFQETRNYVKRIVMLKSTYERMQ